MTFIQALCKTAVVFAKIKKTTMEKAKGKENQKKLIEEKQKQASIESSLSLGKKTPEAKEERPLVLGQGKFRKLERAFFKKEVVELAKALIGKIITCARDSGRFIRCRIVESEAYKAPLDKACHAFNNKKTERTKPFWLEGGHFYIYSIYGSNVCLNIVANEKEVPEAVLIRAVEPIEGLEDIKANRPKAKKDKELTNGPGTH